MNIPINKDFEKDYKSSVWKGFSLHELISVVLGVFAAVLFCLFFWLGLGIPVIVSIYIGIPFGFPIILSGFWKTKNGLKPKDYYAAVKYRKATAMLPYLAGEYPEGWEDSKNCGQKDSIFKKKLEFWSQKRAYRKHIRRKEKERRKEENKIYEFKQE